MNFKLILIALMGFFVSTSLSAQDDMYYQPGDDQYTTTNSYTSNSSNDDNDEYYEEDYADDSDYEYYYSSRIRRFHRPNRGFGFYNSYYVDRHFYDPFQNYGTTIYVVNDYYRPWRHRRSHYNSWAYSRPVLSVNIYNNYGWNSWGNYPYYSYSDPYSCGMGYGNSYYGNSYYGNSYYGGGYYGNYYGNNYYSNNYYSNNYYSNNIIATTATTTLTTKAFTMAHVMPLLSEKLPRELEAEMVLLLTLQLAESHSKEMDLTVKRKALVAPYRTKQILGEQLLARTPEHLA